MPDEETTNSKAAQVFNLKIMQKGFNLSFPIFLVLSFQIFYNVIFLFYIQGQQGNTQKN